VSAESTLQFALRPYLPADAPALAAIFRASIEDLTAGDYDDAQRRVWAAVADDEDAFAGKLAAQLAIVATHGGTPVGFASLKSPTEIDFMYVHPGAAGQGAGSMLCDALEKLAAARGARRLAVDVSDTARAFFEGRGFTAQRRNTVEMDGVWLANTTMEKRLPPPAAGQHQ
jgi:putative acetyltransferase